MAEKRKRARWVWIVIGLCVAGTAAYYAKALRGPSERAVSYSDLASKIRTNEVASLTITQTGVLAKLKSGQVLTTFVPSSNGELLELAEQHAVELVYRSPSSIWTTVAATVTPTVLVVIAVLLTLLLRANSVTRAKVFMSTEDFRRKGNTTGPTFQDVGGNDAAKEALRTIARYLKDPTAFYKIGAKPPRGILLVGPPGTGKTLLARALASEAGCEYFAASGSAFIELFVGVGAGRIRDLFDRARESAPCVVFIDELDAIGRRREAHSRSNSQEHDLALNELLAQLDGFDERLGVVVLAATNRPDVLDQALTRPGRFDQRITVALPDYGIREKILNIHLKERRALGAVSAEVSPSILARQTAGFSGADLAGLVNRASLITASEGRNEVTSADFAACLADIAPPPEKVNSLQKAIESFALGRDAAKAAMVAAVRLHYNRPAVDGGTIARTPCVLLLGERGTLKRTLVRRVAAHLGVAAYTTSASRFDDRAELIREDPLDSLLRDVIRNADGNVKRAERGMLCLTDIDQLVRQGGHDLAHRVVTRLIRGDVIDVPPSASLETAMATRFDMSQTLVVLAGHLPDLEGMIRRRYADRDYVLMKQLMNDEHAELLNLGWSDELMDAVSAVAVCAPLSEEELAGLLTTEEGAACLARFQAILDECSAQVVLKEHLARLAKRIHSRGEGAAGIDGTLNDLCVRILAAPNEKAASALNDFLGETGTSVIVGGQNQDVEVSTVLSELLPSELGAVVAQNQVKDSAPIVLIELPAKTPTDRTTVQQLLPWLRERAISCATSVDGVRSPVMNELASARTSFGDQIEEASKWLEHVGGRVLSNQRNVESLDLLMAEFAKGEIDQLRTLVLLHGMTTRLECPPARKQVPATALLIQAARATAMLDVVRIPYELRGGVRDELGAGSTVASLATALSDGLAEIEGHGLLSDDLRADDVGLAVDRVKEAMLTVPKLKQTICDLVARLRESLDRPPFDLDGLTTPVEWRNCQEHLQRRGDLRNTPNLMLLLSAVDFSVKAMGVATGREVHLLQQFLEGQILGRSDRALGRLRHWRTQVAGFRQLLEGHKLLESYKMWERLDCDPERMVAELRAIDGLNIGDGTLLVPELDDWNRVSTLIDRHYEHLNAQAVSAYERELADTSFGGRAHALVVDEFDSEVIMAACRKRGRSFITVAPAVR